MDEIEQMHLALNSRLHEATKMDFSIIYGGSCNAENSKEIFALNNVNGGLIGGASMNVNSLLQIISNAC
jgi:triosephosphate isomerase